MKRNIVEYLKESAEKYPDKTAFLDERRKITFKELDDEAQKIAALIYARCGNIRNKPIAVYMEKSVECIVSFLGIAYSGNFYSPLDVHSPIERIHKIIDVLQPAAVIYHTEEPDELDDCREKISIQDIEKAEIDISIREKYKNTADIDPLYVLFTSGSTGQPKGVVISHRGVIDYTEWLYDTFSFDADTIFGNQAPFYFDNSILDIYSTLRNGACMVIIPETLFRFPKVLMDYINENSINTIFWVPSALIGLANSGILDKIHADKLQRVLFCGEVMPNKQLNIWRKNYPDILYANLYGPTEITDVCSYYIVNRQFQDEEPLPIGIACRNTEILVLNDNNELVGENELGELCVRGTCLSMGYYGDQEKTSKAFVQNPLNSKYCDTIYRTGDLVKYNAYGELVYVSRKDFQIKHQGHRIELGEIEAAAGSLEGVNQACAVYDNCNKKIVLFCTLSAELTEKMIYRLLQDKLPQYMLPKKIKILSALPLNINGKIDRVTLKSNCM